MITIPIVSANGVKSTISLEQPGVGSTNAPSFVTRASNGNLMLDGKRFRFSGPNIHWLGLSEHAGIRLATKAEIDAVLSDAAAMGANVVRSHAVASVGSPSAIQPTRGSFGNFDPVDYAIKVAKDKGIRLILLLVDNYGYYHGGKNTYLNWRGVSTATNGQQFFLNSTVISDFKAHITAVLNHVNPYTGLAYKNDPTILAWETGNELSTYPTAWTYSSWTDQISRHIKVTLGAKQLVLDGKYGIYSKDTSIDAASLDLPYVDMYSTHSYDTFRSPSGVLKEAAAAKARGKAFILGEYTWTDSAGWKLTDMLNAIETGNVDGDCFWQLYHAAGRGDQFTLHWPGDNANMKTRATQLRNHALTMRD